MTKPLDLDMESEEKRILRFVRRAVTEARARGVVVGLSGGVDSAVTCALCVKALGSVGVLGALLPSLSTPRKDTEDALRMAEAWRIETVTIPITGAVEAVTSAAGSVDAKIPKGNVQARVRMTLLYYLANSRGLLVAGTGDRSEEELGFFTKFGDGGADLLPIAHLYKTQVRALAEHLGLPDAVAHKPSSPHLWPGHTAEEELPAPYDRLDLVLHYLLDLKATPAVAAKRAGVSEAVAKAALEMRRRSSHKRAAPLSLQPSGGTTRDVTKD